ncbi:uncharacterized protein LOC131603526 isoform X2 [Vicia villosa]|uniref:uncharacterized protein LOC131603526 isoform X2 n=1 Tax=Vicia villosa TaxID=3911 RepID=UPI00273BC5E9|nr:uncharacterized protein LOC131603526 isoform X2 [Vicia villosa]XP_058731849.1 uncharacterized protein LOC131603526 isoform X2 [Vicia villosa]XP_058731850.1 uncharacterized protein LOC131603526 isoform X2 [Vicia villosa]
MTGQNGKRKAPSSTTNVVDRLCRQRQIPPGSIAIKNSRMVHMKPGSKNPPPPHTQRKNPPPIQPTKTSLPTQPSPSIHTNPTPPPPQPPPPIQTNPTPPPSQPLSKTRKNPIPPPTNQPLSKTQSNPTPPPIQKNPTPPPTNQPQPSIPTSEEFRFIPTPGYTHHVLQSPPHHTTEEGVQEEGVQGLSNEEQEEPEEQVDGQRPKIYIVEDTALSPGDLVAEMCRKVIEKLYRGTFFNYSELKRGGRDKERKEWFNMFKSLVSWDRCDDAKMEDLFHKRCATRLRDILQKAKEKACKPPWMGVDTWEFLIEKWQTKEFKDVSKQNKINRSSSKGGAVHTSGRRAHHDVALDLAKKLKRPAHPDELFIATHKKKNGEWVDERAATTHETYVSSLTQATQITGNDVDGSTRIQMWKDVAGGKTRGRCYGVAQLAHNVRHGVSFLTQVSISNPNREADNQAIEAARAEAAAAREEAARANARTDELAKQFEDLRKMFDMFQSRQAGSSRAPSSEHAHYNYSEDEDEDEDEEDDVAGDHDQDQ